VGSGGNHVLKAYRTTLRIYDRALSATEVKEFPKLGTVIVRQN
jgi:hypothetical protein